MKRNRYGYCLKVPNNEEGQLFISLVKKFVNKGNHRIVIRGSSPNYEKMLDAGYKPEDLEHTKQRMNRDGSVRLCCADYLRVYFFNKTKQDYEDYWRTEYYDIKGKFVDLKEIKHNIKCFGV